jgi:putative acyl-CoA dehydrogenase
MIATPFPNQPPAFEGRNLATTDPVFEQALAAHAVPLDAGLVAWGATLGSADVGALADAANRQVPRLRTHDAAGERIDAVEFDPAWHALMALGAHEGEHCAPWTAPGPTAQRLRAARYYLHAQVENGTQCPLTMTFAAIPVLQRHAAAAGLPAAWLAAARAAEYDPRPLPIEDKRAALVGMGMTERQGGSDVRANVTRATRAGAAWTLRGHKWFFSAPQCDAHLVLAQADEGLGCFLMPRRLDDGARNAIRINRLKDKLGNRSNASAEVEFDDAHAWLLGEPGRGIATILEMVQWTRLDCVIGSAGIMRAALSRALHWATHRVAFGARLADAPLMQNVLADLALETEAALHLALAAAACLETSADAPSRALARLLVPASKYWVCKRAPVVALECMEAMGGNGYIEEQALPRFYREAPVNSIWEGSGNVICLDVLRALQRHPEAAPAWLALLDDVRGANADLDNAATRVRTIASADVPASQGRRVAQAMATTIAGALLVRHAPAFVSDAYCASRLRHDAHGGGAFGALGGAVDTPAIVRRLIADGAQRGAP